MARPRVSIETPPGTRAWGGQAGEWLLARDQGGTPWSADLADLSARFDKPSNAALYRAEIGAVMRSAAAGRVPRDRVRLMVIAPDVLELKLPDWTFGDGHLHVRLYYSEPADLPGHLVALRLRSKRPGRAGKEEQNSDALSASALLLEFHQRGYH